MKHKLLSILLCCTLTLGLTACDTTTTNPTTSTSSSSGDTIVKDPSALITPFNQQPTTCLLA